MAEDFDKIAAIEKAIAKKYGDETVQNPRANWDEDKEKDYIEQVKIVEARRRQRDSKVERVEIDGVFISKKLLNKERSLRTCPVCEEYSFKSNDGVYMNKYECCSRCYFLYVDGREQRWKNGWRPNTGEKNNG